VSLDCVIYCAFYSILFRGPFFPGHGVRYRLTTWTWSFVCDVCVCTGYIAWCAGILYCATRVVAEALKLLRQQTAQLECSDKARSLSVDWVYDDCQCVGLVRTCACGCRSIMHACVVSCPGQLAHWLPGSLLPQQSVSVNQWTTYDVILDSDRSRPSRAQLCSQLSVIGRTLWRPTSRDRYRRHAL